MFSLCFLLIFITIIFTPLLLTNSFFILLFHLLNQLCHVLLVLLARLMVLLGSQALAKFITGHTVELIKIFKIFFILLFDHLLHLVVIFRVCVLALQLSQLIFKARHPKALRSSPRRLKQFLPLLPLLLLEICCFPLVLFGFFLQHLLVGQHSLVPLSDEGDQVSDDGVSLLLGGVSLHLVLLLHLPPHPPVLSLTSVVLVH